MAKGDHIGNPSKAAKYILEKHGVSEDQQGLLASIDEFNQERRRDQKRLEREQRVRHATGRSDPAMRARLLDRIPPEDNPMKKKTFKKTKTRHAFGPGSPNLEFAPADVRESMQLIRGMSTAQLRAVMLEGNQSGKQRLDVEKIPRTDRTWKALEKKGLAKWSHRKTGFPDIDQRAVWGLTEKGHRMALAIEHSHDVARGRYRADARSDGFGASTKSNPRKKTKKKTKKKTTLKTKAEKAERKAKEVAKTDMGRAGIGGGIGALALGPVGAVIGAGYAIASKKKPRKKNPGPTCKLSTTMGNLLLDYHKAGEAVEHVAASALRGERVELRYVKAARADLKKIQGIQPNESEKEQIGDLVDALSRVIAKCEGKSSPRSKPAPKSNPARAFSLETEVNRSRQKKAKGAAGKHSRASSAASDAARQSLRKRMAALNPGSYRSQVVDFSDAKLDAEHKAASKLITQAKRHPDTSQKMVDDLVKVRGYITDEKKARKKRKSGRRGSSGHVVPVANPTSVGRSKGKFAKLFTPDKEELRLLRKYKMMDKLEDVSASQIERIVTRLKRQEKEELKVEYPTVMDLATTYARARSRYQILITSPGTSAGDIARAKKKFDEAEDALALYAEIRNMDQKLLKEIVWHTKKKEREAKAAKPNPKPSRTRLAKAKLAKERRLATKSKLAGTGTGAGAGIGGGTGLILMGPPVDLPGSKLRHPLKSNPEHGPVRHIVAGGIQSSRRGAKPFFHPKDADPESILKASLFYVANKGKVSLAKLERKFGKNFVWYALLNEEYLKFDGKPAMSIEEIENHFKIYPTNELLVITPKGKKIADRARAELSSLSREEQEWEEHALRPRDNPLSRVTEKTPEKRFRAAISRNIATEMKAGRPQKQAIAIALNQARTDAPKKATKIYGPKPNPEKADKGVTVIPMQLPAEAVNRMIKKAGRAIKAGKGDEEYGHWEKSLKEWGIPKKIAIDVADGKARIVGNLQDGYYHEYINPKKKARKKNPAPGGKYRLTHPNLVVGNEIGDWEIFKATESAVVLLKGGDKIVVKVKERDASGPILFAFTIIPKSVKKADAWEIPLESTSLAEAVQDSVDKAEGDYFHKHWNPKKNPPSSKSLPKIGDKLYTETFKKFIKALNGYGIGTTVIPRRDPRLDRFDVRDDKNIPDILIVADADLYIDREVKNSIDFDDFILANAMDRVPEFVSLWKVERSKEKDNKFRFIVRPRKEPKPDPTKAKSKKPSGEARLGEYMHRGLRSGGPRKETEEFVKGKQKDIFASMRKHAQSEVHDNPALTPKEKGLLLNVSIETTYPQKTAHKKFGKPTADRLLSAGLIDKARGRGTSPAVYMPTSEGLDAVNVFSPLSTKEEEEWDDVVDQAQIAADRNLNPKGKAKKNPMEDWIPDGDVTFNSTLFGSGKKKYFWAIQYNENDNNWGLWKHGNTVDPESGEIYYAPGDNQDRDKYNPWYSTPNGEFNSFREAELAVPVKDRKWLSAPQMEYSFLKSKKGTKRKVKKNPEPTLVTKGKIGIAKFKGQGKGLTEKDLAQLEEIKGNLEIHYELASLYTGAKAKNERARIKDSLRDVNELIRSARRRANPKKKAAKKKSKGKPISDKEFWKQIESLNWPKLRKVHLSKGLSWDEQREGLLKKKPMSYWDEIGAIAQGKADVIVARLDLGVNDFAWDFSSDIVGHGKRTYDRIISDEAWAKKQLDSEKYGAENFFYIFPRDDREEKDSVSKDELAAAYKLLKKEGSLVTQDEFDMTEAYSRMKESGGTLEEHMSTVQAERTSNPKKSKKSKKKAKANPGSSSRITEGQVRKILGKIGMGVRDIVDHPDIAKGLGIESVMEIYTDDRPWDRHSTGHLETPLTVWQRSNGTFDYIYARPLRLYDLKRDYVTSWSRYHASLKDVLHAAIANSKRGKFQGEMAWRKANPGGNWKDQVRKAYIKHWGKGEVGRIGPNSERWKIFAKEVPAENIREPGTDIVIAPRGEAISKPRAQLLASKGIQRIPTERGWVSFDQIWIEDAPEGRVYVEHLDPSTKPRHARSKGPAKGRTKEAFLGEYMQRGLRGGGPRKETEEFVKGRKKDIFASMRKHAQSEVYDNPGGKNSWLKSDGKNDARIHKAINKIGRMSKSEADLYIPKIEKSLQKNIKKMQSGDIHDSMSQEWDDAMFDILFDEFRRSLAKRRAGKKLSRHEAEDIKGIPDAIPAKANPRVGSDLLRFSNRVRYEGSGPGPEGLGLKRNDLVEMEISRGWGTGSFKAFGRVTDVISVPNSSFGKNITGYEISQWRHGEYEGHRNPLSLVWERVGPWYGSGPGSYRKIKWRLKVRDDLYKNDIKDIFEVNEVKRVGRVESDASGAPIQRTIALDPRHREYIVFTETYAKAKAKKAKANPDGSKLESAPFNAKETMITKDALGWFIHSFGDRFGGKGWPWTRKEAEKLYLRADKLRFKGGLTMSDDELAIVSAATFYFEEHYRKVMPAGEGVYDYDRKAVDAWSDKIGKGYRRINRDRRAKSQKKNPLGRGSGSSGPSTDLKDYKLSAHNMSDRAISATFNKLKSSRDPVDRQKANILGTEMGVRDSVSRYRNPGGEESLKAFIKSERARAKSASKLGRQDPRVLNAVLRDTAQREKALIATLEEVKRSGRGGIKDVDLAEKVHAKSGADSGQVSWSARKLRDFGIIKYSGGWKLIETNPMGRKNPEGNPRLAKVGSVYYSVRSNWVGKGFHYEGDREKSMEKGGWTRHSAGIAARIASDKAVRESEWNFPGPIPIKRYEASGGSFHRDAELYPNDEEQFANAKDAMEYAKRLMRKKRPLIIDVYKVDLQEPSDSSKRIRRMFTGVGLPKHQAVYETYGKPRPRYCSFSKKNPDGVSSNKKKVTNKSVREALAKSSVPWKWEQQKPGLILASKGKRTVEIRKWFLGPLDKGWVVSVFEGGGLADGYWVAPSIIDAIKKGDETFKKGAKALTKKKAEPKKVTKKAARDALKKSSAPWEWDGNDRIVAQKGDLSVLLRQWNEDRWDLGWTVHAIKDGVTIEDREEEFDIKQAIKRGEKHFKKTAKKKVSKKKATRKTKPGWKILTDRCDKLWDDYDKKPTKKNLNLVFDHLAKMKASTKYETSKKVRDKRASCLRKANKEAKRLGMKL